MRRTAPSCRRPGLGAFAEQSCFACHVRFFSVGFSTPSASQTPAGCPKSNCILTLTPQCRRRPRRVRAQFHEMTPRKGTRFPSIRPGVNMEVPRTPRLSDVPQRLADRGEPRDSLEGTTEEQMGVRCGEGRSSGPFLVPASQVHPLLSGLLWPPIVGVVG